LPNGILPGRGAGSRKTRPEKNTRIIHDTNKKWFCARNDPPKADAFLQQLEQSKPIQELAKTPILLTLLCLVFEIYDNFPKSRVNLYEEGIDLLLKKWDEQQGVERDQISQYVDLTFIKRLLSYIAFHSFAEQKYLIERRQLCFYVEGFIQTLQHESAYSELSRIDCNTLVKSIQAKHGLLIERSYNTYSFSHLTFQEYFTAREITATNQVDFLVARIGEKRWREVFLLTVGMLRNADELLLAMKSSVDSRLSQDDKLQQFLQWANQKSSSVEVPFKAAAVRAFYLARDLALDLDRDLARDLDRDLARARDLALALDLDRALARDRALALTFSLAFALDLARDFAFALDLAEDPELKRQLQQVFDRLPDNSLKNRENFQKWWNTNSQQWTEDLRQITITHRNIGHDWQFTNAQKALLQQYYDANFLLVQCLNSDCYVSRSVRQEIEDTLLLPMAEIEKRRG
jgi:predicted NACHT family NTPase